MLIGTLVALGVVVPLVVHSGVVHSSPRETESPSLHVMSSRANAVEWSCVVQVGLSFGFTCVTFMSNDASEVLC